MRRLAMALLVSCWANPVAAEPGAFCELTPCLPGPITRRALTKDEVWGGITCKGGRELGTDARGKLAFCTTAVALDVDGLPVKAGAYTLVHPSGRIYQTHLRAPVDRTTADGTVVRCGADLVAIDEAGNLIYCKLAAPRAGSPKARVGEGIRFHANGRLALITLDEQLVIAGLDLAPGASLHWYESGVLAGGYVRDATRGHGFTIRGDFRMHPSGKLAELELAVATKVAGHDFPEDAKLTFRGDGTLERAVYVEHRGFLPHGEEYTHTRHLELDRTGKITSTRREDWQAPHAPEKFRPKKP